MKHSGPDDILHELTRLGIDLQRLHDEKAIFEEMGERLLRLGYRSMILEVSESSNTIRYFRGDPRRQDELEKVLGRPMVGATLALDEPSRQVVEKRQPRFVEHFDAGVFADPSASKIAERYARDLQGVYAPVPLEEERPGILVVFGEGVAADWVDAIGLFATSLSSAMANARLYGELKRRVRELTVLAEVSQAVTAPTDQLLAAAARQVAQLVDASNAFFMLLDRGRQRLVGVAATPPYHDSVAELSISLTERSLCAQCFHENRPQIIEDTGGPGVYHDRYVALHGQRALMALPLRSRNGLIGVLLLGETRGPRRFTGAEMERAVTLANQVAIAVENARLYEDQRLAYEKLAATQNELLRQERLAALGELSAVVAHEVRNPLAAIFNSVSSLRRLLKLEGDGKRLLEIVTEEADHLNRLVADLLDFARPREPALNLATVSEVIDETIASATRELKTQVTFERRVAPDIPPIQVDRMLLRRALVNLTANAVQSMPRGGRVHFVAEPDTRDGRPGVRIEVIDEGPGIPPDLRTKVFEPFFTTKAMGTGLGLAVVKRIVEDHGGQVTIGNRTAPDKGARVTVRLPLASADVPTDPKQ